jgi:phosphoribosylformylglycinamidine synthase
MEINIQETNPQKAKAQAKQMCERLLANTVIEEYMIELKQ